MKPKVYFTPVEAMRAMGVTPQRFERLIEEGKLEVEGDGVRRLIPRESILAYMESVSAVPIRAKRAELTRAGHERAVREREEGAPAAAGE
jgi:excisionase family DNA binding protein